MTVNETKDQAPVNECAMTIDPVITWLEQCRDFMGAAPEARALAQRALDRLRPPALDVDETIQQLRREMGTWRASRGAVVADGPGDTVGGGSGSDVGYYGGRLVAESITRRNAIAISYLPKLLEAAEENAVGRRVLAQLAHALVTPDPPRMPVRDRLDGVMRLAHLADDFQRAPDRIGLRIRDDFFAVADALRAIADGLLNDGSADGLATAADKLRERRQVEA